MSRLFTQSANTGLGPDKSSAPERPASDGADPGANYGKNNGAAKKADGGTCRATLYAGFPVFAGKFV